VYVDSDIFYALLKPSDFNRDLAQRIARDSGTAKVTSVMTLVELAIVAKRDLGEPDSLGLKRRIKSLVPRLRILPLTCAQMARSDGLRTRYGLGIFDAVHASVCLEQDGLMASSDEAFDRVAGIRRVKRS
jgi:predicted nucleic acid-binding protein